MSEKTFLISGDFYYLRASIGVWASSDFDYKETTTLSKRSFLVYVEPSDDDLRKFENWLFEKQVNPAMSPDLYVVVFEGIKYYIIDLFNEPETIFSKYLPLD